MTTFQIAGTLLAVVFAALSFVGIRRGSLSPGVGLAWILLWVAAALAILRPELTVIVARFLGIDRGADLVFYMAILGMFIGFFVVFIRLRRLDETITKVVRQVALQNPGSPAPSDSQAERVEGD